MKALIKKMFIFLGLLVEDQKSLSDSKGSFVRPSKYLSIRPSINYFSKCFTSNNFGLISILPDTQVDYTKVNNSIYMY